jgi:hypothetical protein
MDDTGGMDGTNAVDISEGNKVSKEGNKVGEGSKGSNMSKDDEQV